MSQKRVPPFNFVSSFSWFGTAYCSLTVHTSIGQRSTEKEKRACPGFGISSGAEAQLAEGSAYHMP